MKKDSLYTDLDELLKLYLEKVEKNNLNAFLIERDGEKYIFIYDDENVTETLRTLGRYDSNPELNFTWYEANILYQKIKEELENKY